MQCGDRRQKIMTQLNEPMEGEVPRGRKISIKGGEIKFWDEEFDSTHA